MWRELRHPERSQFSIAEMLEHEQLELMPMPAPFDGYVESLARVSSTCLVMVKSNRYSVPCELAGQMVAVRLYPQQVMAQVLAAVPGAGLEAVLVAVELVLESGAVSAEHVFNMLARLKPAPVPERVETALRLKEAPLADTSRYDSLRATAGEDSHA